MTVTISGDVASEIDKIAKKKKSPRSRVIEEMLRDGLLKSKKRAIEKALLVKRPFAGRISDKKMKEIEKAISIAIGVM